MADTAGGVTTRSRDVARSKSEQQITNRKKDKSPRNSPQLAPADVPGKAFVPKQDETKAPSKWHKMAVRTGVAFAGMAVMTSVMLSDHMVIILAIGVLQTLVFAELVSVRQDHRIETRKIPGFRTLNWFGYLVSLVYIYGKDIAIFYGLHSLVQYHFYIVFCGYILFFLGFVAQLAATAAREGGGAKSGAKKVALFKYQFSQLAWTALIIFLCVFQLTFVTQHILEGVFWFFMPCSLVVMNDTSAYFCGFFMGKKFINRPLTALSPNKTWEGFIGAILLTGVWGWFVSGWLSNYSWMICPRRTYEVDATQCTAPDIFVPRVYHVPEIYNLQFTARPIQLHIIPLALFASLIAPFGGFLASGMKRAYGIKDFSSVIPGHGGFTDRMDCQFIMLFCTHVHYRTFIAPLPATLAGLTHSISHLTGPEQLVLMEKLKEMLTAKGLV